MTKIIFGDWKSNKELKGIKLMDMHCHSNLSDGAMSAGEIIGRAKELNIGVCITDHNCLKGSLLACKEILSMPAIELTSSECHDILAYFNSEKDSNEFFNKNVDKKEHHSRFFDFHKLGLSNSELLEKLDNYNCLVVLPHPFIHKPKESYSFFSREENKKLLKKIDAIEGVNGITWSSRNKKAMLWADKIGKPVIGGTDAHILSHIGNVMTGCFAETRAEFLESIRSGKNYVIVAKELRFYERWAELPATLFRNLRW